MTAPEPDDDPLFGFDLDDPAFLDGGCREQALIEYTRTEARRLADDMRPAAPVAGRPEPMTLRESLDAPPEAAGWRVHQLTRIGGTVTSVGARKVGKTTLMGNYARAVLSGEPFLGSDGRAVGTTPLPGGVFILSSDVREQLDGWLVDQGLDGVHNRITVAPARACQPAREQSRPGRVGGRASPRRAPSWS